MATALTSLTPASLNPHFFAYGQFPLYLGYFILRIVGIPNNFESSIMILRIISATAGFLMLFSLFWLWRLLFKQKSAIPLLVLVLASPGLIQIAHFGTTESLLTLIFPLTLCLSVRIYQNPQSRLNYFLYSLVLSIAVATKISALIFIVPVIISSLFIIIKSRFKLLLTTTLSLLLVIFSSLLLSLFFSPASFLNLNEFLSSINYETSVATGELSVFYTRQFEGTLPYLFQLTHIFPYVWGLPVFLLSLLSLAVLVIKFVSTFRRSYFPYLIVGLSTIAYYLYFGQTFTKWTRFQSPIFFVGPILTALFIVRIKNKLLSFIVMCLCLVPGILFYKIYLVPDIRLTASNWLIENIPAGSTVLTEGGNVVNLPVNPPSYEVINFDFYQVDSNPNLASELTEKLKITDYIIVPSRRIFKNQNNSRYPVSQNYYQQLFSPSSNFKLIKTFSPQNSFILNSENAEETYTVFDHPTIRVYQKI